MSSGALTSQIEAHGLAGQPDGRITAQGDLLDAPLDWRSRCGRRMMAWRSISSTPTGRACTPGCVQLPTATMVPAAIWTSPMRRLADLAPLIGQPIAGRAIQPRLPATTPGTAHPGLDAQVDAEATSRARLDGTRARIRLRARRMRWT